MKMRCKDQAKVDELNRKDAELAKAQNDLWFQWGLRNGERNELHRQIRDQYEYEDGQPGGVPHHD